MEAPKFVRTSLRDFLYLIFKRKTQILLFFLVTFSTVVVGTFIAKPTYQATAQILVKMGRESIYVPEIGRANPVISINRQEQINSEIEILKSRSLAQKVVNVLGPTIIYAGLGQPNNGILASFLHRYQEPKSPAEEALLALQSKLEIQAIKDSDIIEVSFKHTDPQMAAIVLKELANHYLERHLSVHKSSRSHNFFRQQADYLRDKLSREETQLRALKAKYNITSLEEQQLLLLTKITELRSEKDRTMTRIVEAQNRKAHLRKQLAVTPATVPLSEEIEQNPTLTASLQDRLIELKLKEKKMLTQKGSSWSTYTEQSRLVQNVSEEIRLVEKTLEAQKNKRSKKIHIGLNETYRALQEEVFRNEADVKALTAKKEILRAQLADYQKMLEKLNQSEMKLNHLQNEVDINRQNYKLYLSKFEESRISEAMDTEKITSVTLIEPVQVPIKPVSQKRFVNIVLGLFLGAFGGLGLAFFFHYLDDTLETIEDVEEKLQIPVLASSWS